MEDQPIIEHIDALVAEEHRLEARAHELTPAERARLAEVEVRLDQAWDLLRQRRARRHAGQDPDEAAERPADTVEGFLQ